MLNSRNQPRESRLPRSPYYDNISYADLSDFFYVWLRRSLKNVFPTLFATLAVPRLRRLVATTVPTREQGESRGIFPRRHDPGHAAPGRTGPSCPFPRHHLLRLLKQVRAERQRRHSCAPAGETFLDAVIRAGFGVSGTWPIRTEPGKPRSWGIAFLTPSPPASSRLPPRPADAPVATRRSSSAGSRPSCPKRCGFSSAATSPRWTWLRPRSARDGRLHPLLTGAGRIGQASHRTRCPSPS